MNPLYKKLEDQLQNKQASPDQVRQANSEVDEYIDHLQAESPVDLSLGLEAFIKARR